MTNKTGLGLVHIYTGDGKGKTTAALGLCLRALAGDFKVAIIQFMKAESEESGEITAIKQYANVTAMRFGGNLLRKDHAPIEIIKNDVSAGLKEAVRLVKSGSIDLMVLDEINVAVSMGLAGLQEIIDIANLCSGKVELVMTGRNAPTQLIEIGDYVTEFRMVKHPFKAGISARRGIEY